MTETKAETTTEHDLMITALWTIFLAVDMLADRLAALDRDAGDDLADMLDTLAEAIIRAEVR
jgi:hypothetical protein